MANSTKFRILQKFIRYFLIASYFNILHLSFYNLLSTCSIFTKCAFNFGKLFMAIRYIKYIYRQLFTLVMTASVSREFYLGIKNCATHISKINCRNPASRKFWLALCTWSLSVSLATVANAKTYYSK